VLEYSVARRPTRQFSYVTVTGRLHKSRRQSHDHDITSRDIS
jgi:hypothetical protein